MARFETWLASFAGVAIAVAASYQWIDRPVSFFAHDHLVQYRYFAELTKISEWLLVLAAIVLVAAGVMALRGHSLRPWQSVMVLASLSTVATETIKQQLKYLFGRTWPDTWINNNPSLIHDGVYGFNPFHGGAAYASFPSGHTSVVCAAMSVLWLCCPKYRPLYALLVAAVVLGLLGANYHFVGDVIAGGFVGVSTGYAAVLLWRSACKPTET